MLTAAPDATQPLFMASTEAARAAMLTAVRRLCATPHDGDINRLAVLAEPVTARQDLPPFRASAMDGYAARQADLARQSLHVVGESLAGKSFHRALAPGEAVRIFTGAAVPEGADIVVIQEEAVAEESRVRLAPANPAKDNIRAQGIDLMAGEAVLPPGRRLDPAALGLVAAAGHAAPAVAMAPRVALLCTGSELAKPGAPIGPDQIFESNSPALAALVRAWGGLPHVLAPQADDQEAIAAAARSADAAQVLVVVGGASVGDHDLAKPALEGLGLSLLFNKIRMRPGKPTWFGRIGEQLVLGLPGNPASAFVCAHIFLKPLLLALQGAEPGPITPLRARLAAPLKAEGPREGFLRARLWVGEDATLWADASLDQDSSLTSILAAANGCIRRAANVAEGTPGDIVEAFLFEGRSL
jgi:molybdopterin molybdotransferase